MFSQICYFSITPAAFLKETTRIFMRENVTNILKGFSFCTDTYPIIRVKLISQNSAICGQNISSFAQPTATSYVRASL